MWLMLLVFSFVFVLWIKISKKRRGM